MDKEPGQRDEDAFGASVSACGEWVEANGRLPRLSGATTPSERRGGRFLFDRRRAASGRA